MPYVPLTPSNILCAHDYRVALFASVNSCYLTMSKMGPPFAHHVNWNTPVIVFMASVVEMATAADYLNNGNYVDADRVKWGVAVGVFSTVVCMCQLAMLYAQIPLAKTLSRPLSILLVLILLCLCGVLSLQTIAFLRFLHPYLRVAQPSPTLVAAVELARMSDLAGGHLGARSWSHNQHQRYTHYTPYVMHIN